MPDEIIKKIEADKTPLYTKEDMAKAIEQARAGTLPPEQRLYTFDDMRNEILKTAALAGQVASKNRTDMTEQLDPGGHGGLLMTMGQVEKAVEAAIGKALVQLFDDLGLPIGTREEKRQTVLKLEEMMKLNSTSRKFVVGVTATVLTIVTTVAGGYGIWLATHGAMH